MNWFYDLHPVGQALVATVGTWLVTAAGAALVFFSKRFSQKYLDAALGSAAGVMIAASFWSLLAPAVEMSANSDTYGDSLKWLPPLAGFLLGAIVLRVIDRLLPHFYPALAVTEGPETSWQRSNCSWLRRRRCNRSWRHKERRGAYGPG
ncbi:MAG: hypothetical protein QGI33_01435, partial [Candidatus Brocadiia bacterium]|nr:hypothetical protein [Candidatus Brocadiia bacterium]